MSRGSAANSCFRSGVASLALGLGFGCGALQAQPELHRDMVVNSSVEAGTRSRLWFVWGLQPDCSTRRGFNVRVTNMPRHGSVNLEKTNQIVSINWVQPHMGPRKVREAAYCSGRTAPVISVFYTPKPGFRGEDVVAVITTNANSSRQNAFTFRISVR